MGTCPTDQNVRTYLRESTKLRLGISPFKDGDADGVQLLFVLGVGAKDHASSFRLNCAVLDAVDDLHSMAFIDSWWEGGDCRRLTFHHWSTVAGYVEKPVYCPVYRVPNMM